MLATLGATASSCGLPSGDDQSEEVAATFWELRRAYLSQDYRRVCDHLSSSARREVGSLGHALPSTCPKDVAANMSAAVVAPRDRVDPEIESIEIDGDDATVVAVMGGTTPARASFVKQNGEWKLAKLFGTTAPPPPDLR